MQIVPRCEVAPVQQGNAHGREIVECNGPEVRIEIFARRRWATLDLKTASHIPIADRQRLDRAGRLHPGHGLDVWKELAVKLDTPLSGVMRARQIDPKGQNVAGIKSGIHSQQAHQALDEQPGAYQQHRRESHFAHHQYAAHGIASPRARSGTGDLQWRGQVATQRLSGGNKAEQKAGQE